MTTTRSLIPMVRFQSIGTFLVLFLVCFSLFLNISCGVSPANNSSNQVSSNEAVPPISYNSANRSSTDMLTKVPADPVGLALEEAIDGWSHWEAGSYAPATNLTSLWQRDFSTVAYNPTGIDRLCNQIREQPQFQNCYRANDGLTRQMFHDEGLRTVGHLYDHLNPCS